MEEGQPWLRCISAWVPQDVLQLGTEPCTELYYCQLEAQACYVFTEQLGRFALVGESLSMQPPSASSWSCSHRPPAPRSNTTSASTASATPRTSSRYRGPQPAHPGLE